MMQREQAERLFRNDCEVSIFRATVGNYEVGEPFSVNVYPRRTGAGYVWLVWDCRKPLTNIGLHAIHCGNKSQSTNKGKAIQEAVAELLKISSVQRTQEGGDG